ncbi:TolC family protein [Helicobacter sp. MIT 00-7814]|uniref:TolC family protein n=1 Tax=unclassified Helicobacter TaxID=2593540 RepID=UPI000E1F2073|nr:MULTISPECIES: TolC family protein [unclassified Helicobacter]RDU56150.1 TolC family protein [Helicobacter sp. MIT 99-10781]RDU56247.1 TolC family protein [Helicobacter sp. MIT 00-7814]
MNKSRKFTLLFFMLFVWANGEQMSQSTQESSTLDVKSAWEKVLENNDALKAQEHNLARAQKLALGAKLSFLPEINFKGAYLYFDEAMQHSLNTQMQSTGIPQTDALLSGILSSVNKPITLLERDVMVGAFNIIYPLYTGGARVKGIKIAEIAKKDAAEAMRLKKLATFEEFVTIYYGSVLAKDLQEVCEENFEASMMHYNNALDLEKSGQIARLEVLASQVASDKSKNTLRSAQNARLSADLALNSALSTQDSAPSSKIEVSSKPLYDENYYVQKALQSYPALRSLDLKIESANEATSLARASFLPQVVGMGSYIFTDKQDSLLVRSIPTWYVGVGVNIPIISPTARLQRYQASKITTLELESLKAQAIKDITLLVRRTYKEALFAREEYESLNSSIILAQENLKLQTNAFKQGLATSAQVIDAQNSLQSVLVEQKSVGFKAIVALAKLLALSDEIETFYEYQR